MDPYAIPRRPSGRHPTLGAFLGFVLLLVLVPYTLGYGIAGLAGALIFAGALAGSLARGGTSMGFGAGARAATGFSLLLLTAWSILLLQESGMLDLTSSPQMAEFVPYVLLIESLWQNVSQALDPLVQSLSAMFGGDRIVDLLLRVVFLIIPGGLGGAMAGTVVGGRPQRIGPAMPPGYGPGYGPGYVPGYGQEYHPGNPYGDPTYAPQEQQYLCPWCGLSVTSTMDLCWNCGGPLGPPAPY